MNSYHLYSLETGLFLINVIQCDPEHLDEFVPDGCGAVLGECDMLAQAVDLETGEVVDYQPPQPSLAHVWDVDSKRWIVPPTLDNIKAKRRKEINDECTSRLTAIITSYPPDEVQSWAQQMAEAQAYRAGGTETPLLSALSTARGIALDDLVGRVLVKATQYAIVSGQIIGKRQRCIDQIDAAQSSDDVGAVTWPNA